MTDHQNTNLHCVGAVYRVVWGTAGLLFAGFGVCVIFVGVVSLPVRIGAGALAVLLGVNAVWSALQSKESWLARIFPFV